MLKKEVSETKQEQNVDAEVMILSSLAKPDALKIFSACEKGMGSSTEAIKNLCLTPKCYYTNLKRLIDAGLVEKRGQIYVQTALGKFCSKMEKAFSRAVSQRDKLQLTDKLMDSNTLSTEEKEKILNVIEDPGLTDIIHEVKMITNYDVFINDLIEMLDNTKETAYVAARTTDLRVADAIARVANRGVKLFILSNIEKSFKERLHTAKSILNPELIRMLRDYFSVENLSIRLTNLSYNFCVTDGECGIIELRHPGGTNPYYVAFKFRNKSFCQKIIEAFNSLYENGKEDSLVNYVRKLFLSHK